MTEPTSGRTNDRAEHTAPGAPCATPARVTERCGPPPGAGLHWRGRFVELIVPRLLAGR